MAVLIGTSLISLLVFLLWRVRSAVRVSSAYAEFATRRSPGDYHAVHIEFCEEGACAAVRRHRGQRYLGKQAPVLPLADCAVAECLCRYSHYDDRRKIMLRRAVDNGFDAKPYEGPERRDEDERRNRKRSALNAHPDQADTAVANDTGISTLQFSVDVQRCKEEQN